jgi:hypothetical protein
MTMRLPPVIRPRYLTAEGKSSLQRSTTARFHQFDETAELGALLNIVSGLAATAKKKNPVDKSSVFDISGIVPRAVFSLCSTIMA